MDHVYISPAGSHKGDLEYVVLTCRSSETSSLIVDWRIHFEIEVCDGKDLQSLQRPDKF